MKNLLFLLSLLIGLSACAPTGKKNVHQYFEALYTKGEFNGNVLIASNDTILYKSSFGYARGNRTTALTDNHFFQVGSIYKEFPAVAIMQLEEKSLLTLEDPISAHINSLPKWAEKITIKHLLQYASGLPVIDWGALFQADEIVSYELVLKQLYQLQQLEFEPGSDYLYSNYNPFLLIQIIESVSELSFEQYLTKHILTPHTLEGIKLTYQFPYQDTTQAKFAYPFNEDFEEDDLVYSLPTICATSSGMYQWFTLLDDFQIITKESVRALSEEAIEGDNIQAPLGRADWKNDELILHLHHGSTGNYESLVRNYKAESLMIVLLTNQKHGNLHEIADDIADIVRKLNN